LLPSEPQPIIRDVQVQEAKDFLVQQTAKQALLDGIPLSDLEKRMMYFTESEDAVEDPIALNAEFDSQFDAPEYETKVGELLHHAYARLKKEKSPLVQNWREALACLGKGDHYLSVLWGYEPDNLKGRPRFDQLKLFGAGLAIACIALFVGFIADRYFPNFFRDPIGGRVLYYGLAFLAIAFGYYLKARRI
jgi:hypothetical protein